MVFDTILSIGKVLGGIKKAIPGIGKMAILVESTTLYLMCLIFG
jgi:hypothetical protein